MSNSELKLTLLKNERTGLQDQVLVESYVLRNNLLSSSLAKTIMKDLQQHERRLAEVEERIEALMRTTSLETALPYESTSLR